MIECLICGQHFERSFSSHFRYTHEMTTKTYYDTYIDPQGEKKYCPICGEDNKWQDFKSGYSKFCSKSCSNKDPKQIELRKKGIIKLFKSDKGKEVIKKREITCLEKYGHKTFLQSKIGLEKTKDSLWDKYGIRNPSELDNNHFKDGRYGKSIKRLTAEERYGKEKAKNVYSKQKQTQKSNYYSKLLNSNRLKEKVVPMFSLDEYTGVSNKKYEFKCVKCSGIFLSIIDNGNVPRCKECYPVIQNSVSSYEREITSWLEDIGIKNITTNSRSIISPKEIDIFLPDYNLGIEFDGLYWHSEISGGKDKNYHLDKTNACEEQGISLIHIFEDEWVDKQSIVKSIIKNKLGISDRKIYARKCKVKEVSNKDCELFLFDNHIQGGIRSKHKFGLYYEDELVYLITLSKPRFDKSSDFELLRSCSKLNTSVVGGFQKLIKFAFNELNIKSLVSYVDKRFFNGSSYRSFNTLSMSQRKDSTPGYFYINNYGRESRMKYQKHKLKKFSEYEEILTEWQIMQLKGFDRIYDCGNKVFTLQV